MSRRVRNSFAACNGKSRSNPATANGLHAFFAIRFGVEHGRQIGWKIFRSFGGVEEILNREHLRIKRGFAGKAHAYELRALSTKSKELLGLVASMVRRDG